MLGDFLLFVTHMLLNVSKNDIVDRDWNHVPKHCAIGVYYGILMLYTYIISAHILCKIANQCLPCFGITKARANICSRIRVRTHCAPCANNTYLTSWNFVLPTPNMIFVLFPGEAPLYIYSPQPFGYFVYEVNTCVRAVRTTRRGFWLNRPWATNNEHVPVLNKQKLMKIFGKLAHCCTGAV